MNESHRKGTGRRAVEQVIGVTSMGALRKEE